MTKRVDARVGLAGDEAERALYDALERFETRLTDDDVADAERTLDALAGDVGQGHPEVLFGRARLVWHSQGPLAAHDLLEKAVAADATHADAVHALAQAAEARGEHARMVELFLKVHALDARAHREARIGSRRDVDHIERVAREVLAALPSPFGERLTHVPVVLEARPSRAEVREGTDPRLLGLFDGPTDGDTATPAPTRIVLYVNNLLWAFPDDDELDEEIEITLLHEIGHFFRLDEDDMERLGLA